MKKLFCLMVAGLMSAALAAEAPKYDHPDSSKWADVFRADLSDATCNKEVWKFEDGVLSANKDEAIWTKAEWENYTLDLEFKNDKATNSGVVVYCTNIGNWIPNSVELQILDDYADKWKTVAPNWKCASAFGHQPPVEQTVKPAGEWNRMTITCRGKIITIALNGKLVNTIDMDKFTDAKKNPDGSDVPAWLSNPMAKMATKGFVGFQGKHGDALIYFRNLKIKSLD